jgi:hypothetical protein
VVIERGQIASRGVSGAVLQLWAAGLPRKLRRCDATRVDAGCFDASCRTIGRGIETSHGVHCWRHESRAHRPRIFDNIGWLPTSP